MSITYNQKKIRNLLLALVLSYNCGKFPSKITFKSRLKINKVGKRRYIFAEASIYCLVFKRKNGFCQICLAYNKRYGDGHLRRLSAD